MDKVLCISPEELDIHSVTQGFADNYYQFIHKPDIVEAAGLLQDSDIKFVIIYADETDEAQVHLAMLRRAARRYIYILLLTKNWPVEAALELGANDILPVQATTDDVMRALDKYNRLFAVIEEIGDQRVDFPSIGGVIARSAFHQLFLTGIDRASRYGEKTYILFISLNNYNELYDIGGDYVADYAVAMLSKKLTGMRRQSDILGQITKHSYALLLQRPTYETEPLEAAQRFASALIDSHEIAEGAPVPLQVKVMLVDIPCGGLLHNSLITLEKP